MKLTHVRTLAVAALIFSMGCTTVQADQPAPPTNPTTVTPSPNRHKSYDKRFNACKAAARTSGVAAEAYQAFMKDCMSKSH